MNTTVFAAWTPGTGQNTTRWWYGLEDGSYYAGTDRTPRWEWIDGNGDNVAECYAFDAEGWMYSDTNTPDGYRVNPSGAWTINGEVQTRRIPVAAENFEKRELHVDHQGQGYRQQSICGKTAGYGIDKYFAGSKKRTSVLSGR